MGRPSTCAHPALGPTRMTARRLPMSNGRPFLPVDYVDLKGAPRGSLQITIRGIAAQACDYLGCRLHTDPVYVKTQVRVCSDCKPRHPGFDIQPRSTQFLATGRENHYPNYTLRDFVSCAIVRGSAIQRGEIRTIFLKSLLPRRTVWKPR